MNWPKPFTHTTHFTDWLNRLLQQAKRSELKSVVGGRLNKTTDGMTLVIDRQEGGSSAGMIFRGVWSAGTYAENDVVIIQSGAAAGTYISMTGSNTNDPATGVNWLQIAPGNTVGNWT